MRYIRSFALALVLAFLIIPAAPLGGIVPIPTVGGEVFAEGECLQFDEASGYWCPPPEEIGTPPPVDPNDAICATLDGARQGAWAAVAGSKSPGQLKKNTIAALAAEAAYLMQGC